MADKKKRVLREVSTLDQWIEVTTREGGTVTEIYPSNQELKEKLAHMSPPPDLICRRIHFRGGVPLEYAWVEPNARQIELGGICIQRLTVNGWLELSSCEGHLTASHDPRPRPKVRGECDCQTCRTNRERLEAAGCEVL